MDNEEMDETFCWLDEVESTQALKWVKNENSLTIGQFSEQPSFSKKEQDILKILSNEKKIPYGKIYGNSIYNFWQDKKNARGLLRRAEYSSYIQKETVWETVLDLDELSTVESEDWVYKKILILEPALDRALIFLSKGGKDACVIREFNLNDCTFNEEGFNFPESKADASWINNEQILQCPALNIEEQTKSGYPRSVHLLTRQEGTLSNDILFEGDIDDVMVTAKSVEINHKKYALIIRAESFFEREYFLSDLRGILHKLPIPKSSLLPSDLTSSSFAREGELILLLKDNWAFKRDVLEKDSIVSLNLEKFINYGEIEVKSIYTPDLKEAITDIAVTKDKIYISLLHDVKSRLLVYSNNKKNEDIDLPKTGTIKIHSCSRKNNKIIVSYEDFLTPTYLAVIEDEKIIHPKIKSLPDYFDASSFTSHQYFAPSKDGTKIPYFVICSKALIKNYENPTLMYGYGGFDIPITPSYLTAQNIKWLEAGGVYVVANIRGGGEYGSTWHKAAQKHQKHKSYEDFIAVSEKLIEDRITSPAHLSIQGGSNGGLLMGAMLTQRPDLFGAIICQVPLLDMLKFHELLAGASWVGEYGNPEIEADRNYLKSYSPFHNLKKDVTYPKVFFTTSTKDDRVHPGHARRMVAKMKSMGHQVNYYENEEGGHGGASTPTQQAKISALLLSFLETTVAN